MDKIIQVIQRIIATAPGYMATHKVICIIWILLAIITILAIAKDLMTRIKVLDQSAVINLMNKNECVLVDVRNDSDFYAGYINGSLHISLSDIQAGVLSPIEKHKNSTLVLVSKDGFGYQNINLQLKKHGFNTMYGLREGISGWKSSGLPLVNKIQRKQNGK